MAKRPLTPEYSSQIRETIQQNWQASPQLAEAFQIDLEHHAHHRYLATGAQVWQLNSHERQQLEHLHHLNLTHQTKNRVVSKGAAFYEALDPFLSSQELLTRALHRLEHLASHEPKTYQEQYVLLDYWKSIALQTANVLFALQKQPNRQHTPIESLALRSQDQHLTQLKHAMRHFYHFLHTQEFDWSHVQPVLTNYKTFLLDHAASLGQLCNSTYKLSECTHPLRMSLTAAHIANHHPNAQHIVGVPCGGTEVALLLQLAYQQQNKNLPLTFVPGASFHSKLDNQETQLHIEQQLAHIPESQTIVVIDDNTATGTTLETIQEQLYRHGAHQVHAYAVEADLHRMRLRQAQAVSLPDDQFLRFSTGILPVTRKSHRHGNYQAGSNVINERGREVLALRYLEQALQSESPTEQLPWYVRAHLVQLPTDRLVRQSRENPLAVTLFRGTEFSNFWPVTVQLNGHTFPSVEHAYKWSKHPSISNKTLRSLISDQSQIPNEFHLHTNKTFLDVMTDPQFSASSCKHLDDALHAPNELNNSQRLQVMAELLLQKFTHEPFRSLLLATDTAPLIETTTWDDTFWGISAETLKGHNILGRLLMEIRRMLQSHSTGSSIQHTH